MDQGATSPNARAQQRSRGFSFRSDHSNGSKGKADRITESPEEKRRRDSIWKADSKSKANPNAAITEAQPGGE